MDPISTLPVVAVKNGTEFLHRALTILLIMPTLLLLVGCYHREDRDRNLTFDEGTQAEVREDFYTAVRETVEITTAYTGHDPSIYTHGNGETFNIAEVQPDSDYYPYIVCGNGYRNGGPTIYELTIRISDESENLTQYTPEEYKKCQTTCVQPGKNKDTRSKILAATPMDTRSSITLIWEHVCLTPLHRKEIP